MLLKDNKIAFSDNRIAFADDMNENISFLSQDLNSLILRTSNLESYIYRYIGLYNEDYIEQLRYKLHRLRNQIEALKSLAASAEYSRLVKLNFDDHNEKLGYSSLYYRDPKTNLPISDSDSLSLDTKAGSLVNSSTTITSAPIKNIKYGVPSNLENVVDLDGYKNIYILSNDYRELTIDLEIELDSASDINNITLDSISIFPFNINSIEFQTSTSVPLVYSKMNIFGNESINFGTIEDVTSITISIGLPYCKATNQYLDYTGESLLRNISNGDIPLQTLSSPNSENYSYYVYHFGVKDVTVNNIDVKDFGVYVSDSTIAQSPAHFYLETNALIENMSIEFYLIKNDFDVEYNKIGSTNWIPLSISGATSISKEILIPIENNTFSDTLLINNAIDIDDVTTAVFKIAKLSFAPDKTQSIVIKEDGITYSSSNYYISDKYVYFLAEPSGSLYAIDYTPYFSTNLYSLSPENPHTEFSKTVDFSYSLDNTIKIKIVDDAVVELDANTNDPDQMDYLKFILPFDYDTTTLSLERWIVGADSVDASAPVYNMTGDNKNVYVSNRKIYIPFNSSLYPKLYNSIFRVSGTLNGNSIIDNIPLYYNVNGDAIINWEYYKSIYNDEYLNSSFNLMVIARSNSSNLNPRLNIQDVFLYYNTFNDLITVVA